jgi:hypothetical protein
MKLFGNSAYGKTITKKEKVVSTNISKRLMSHISKI